MSEFAIFRVQKLKAGSRGSGTLGQTLKHLKYHLDSAEISNPQNSKYNFLTGCTDYKETLKAVNYYKDEHKKHNLRAVKKDSCVACECVFSYTKTKQNQTLEYAQMFEQSIKTFCEQKFPEVHLVAFARHTDEESYHWHLVFIPFDKQKRRFSAKDLLGGPREMSKLQDDFFNCCKSLGLLRGISKEITKSNHKTKQEHNRQKLLQQEQQLQEIAQIKDDVLGKDEVLR